MASSKVMASRSPPNQDPPTQPSSSPLNLRTGHSRGFGSVNMDDLFRNIYSESESFVLENTVAGGDGEGGDGGGGEAAIRNGNESKTVDEVWRDIMGGGSAGASEETRMTLEDFLAKAGAVDEEDVRVLAGGAFGMETPMMNPVAGVPVVQYGSAMCVQNGYDVEFGNGIPSASGIAAGGSGRGKRRAAVEDAPMDKATQQKQRRMIKNRESAARSRERKQAYTVELESLVAQLEEDNARLLKEDAELNKKRYKQLMETLIPVVGERRPRKVLGRTQSMEW